MENPHFRRNLILVAAFHILLIGGILYFTKREIKKNQGDITWVNPGSFAEAAAAVAASASAGAAQIAAIG